MTKLLTRSTNLLPTFFEDIINPWNSVFGSNGFFPSSGSVPAVNITTSNGDYLFSMAVPGMKKEDFKIDYDDSLLTISCEKEETNEEKNAKYTRKEYNFSSFKRSFSIPTEINVERIEAHYQDGILHIKLPIKEALKLSGEHKHIAVK